jgi:hypothetical protein
VEIARGRGVDQKKLAALLGMVRGEA